jgi:hypothetical protein
MTPLADRTDETLTLACQGSRSVEEGKSEPISISHHRQHHEPDYRRLYASGCNLSGENNQLDEVQAASRTLGLEVLPFDIRGAAIETPRPPNWPPRRHAVVAIIIAWDGELGVSYTYPSGAAEAGPIGPEDWPAIQALEREGKLSFISKKIHQRFLKLRAARSPK